MSHRSPFLVPRPARPSVRAARNRLVQYSGHFVLASKPYDGTRPVYRCGAVGPK
jgi:hypothetical protein